MSESASTEPQIIGYRVTVTVDVDDDYANTLVEAAELGFERILGLRHPSLEVIPVYLTDGGEEPTPVTVDLAEDYELLDPSVATFLLWRGSVDNPAIASDSAARFANAVRVADAKFPGDWDSADPDSRPTVRWANEFVETFGDELPAEVA